MATQTYYMSPASLIVQYLTNLGILAQGGKVYTYQGGTVSTPLTTYTDSTGLTANPNPMTLNSAGRPVSSSGAPVAFWQVAGVALTLVVYDASGNLLVSLPNIPAINDPSSTGSLGSQLANPATGYGADLVANAVKSYATIANVRAANIPSLASGQTLTIEIQGAVSIDDGLGGTFYWQPTSTAADNGTTVINPTSNSGSGRYLRLYYPPFGAESTIVAAANTDLGTLATNIVNISGNTAITSFGSSASVARPFYVVSFSGFPLLTASSSLILPGGASIGTNVNDSLLAVYLGSGVWQVLQYFQAAGGAVQYRLTTVDQSVTSSTTLVNVSQLVSEPLVAGGTYLIQIRLQWLMAASGSQGWKAQATFSGTLTGQSSGFGLASGGGTLAPYLAQLNVPQSSSAVQTAAPADVWAADIVFNVATAGTMTMQIAQYSSSASATTLKANSAMIITRLT